MGAGRDQLHIFKSPGEDLRIRWTAAVHEEGGEFVISRQGADGASRIVAHVSLRAGGRYEVVEPGSHPGSWIYQLRYRSRQGREQVLLTFNLSVERFGSEPLTTTVLTHAPQADTWATLDLAPRESARWSPESSAPRLGGPSRWPPTPPP